MNGEATYNTLRAFADTCDAFLDSQPPASDLDASEAWIRELNAMMARAAQMRGIAEAAQAQLTKAALDGLQVDSDEYKKIRNSSTLAERYTAGKWPNTWAVAVQVIFIGKVLSAVAENTRTLMSSYRLEREIESRTTVRQQR